MKLKRNVRYWLAAAALAVVAGVSTGVWAQNAKISEIEKQKASAEQEIRETKAELNANEKQVNKSLAALRKIDGEIATTVSEIETVQGQIDVINGNISRLEGSIAVNEKELEGLRTEYLQAVRKMRTASKQKSDLAFLFSSKSFNEARRRMRYMKEFSEWKDRRSGEILEKVDLLRSQRAELVQAQQDASVALKRQMAAKEKLTVQRREQQENVNTLRENSEELKAKLARRQSEARKLSNQISALIAEERAKEEERKRKEAEQRRIAEEKAAAERKAAEQKKAEQERLQAEAAAKKEAEKKETAARQDKSEKKTDKKKEPEKNASKAEYAEARKRQPRSAAAASTSAAKTAPAPAGSDFASMQGRLPRPVAGSFRIVSPFGVHPISPDLPDIMDENLGIDAHVANGAAACAVFEGDVIKVYDRTNTPGFRNIIVLKHGDYITVYANLESLAVKTGQHVKQGQRLGTVGADFDEPSQGLIHFEVWKNQTHLNPEAWIN